MRLDFTRSIPKWTSHKEPRITRTKSPRLLHLLPLNERLKATESHALDVKRHLHGRLLGLFLLLHLGYDFLVHGISVRFVLINNEGKKYCLGRFDAGHRLEIATSRHPIEIVASALEVLQRAVLHPHLLAPCGHLLICRHIFLRYRYNES